jgi:citrate lyase subunit beta/citryl-CoA lyase
MVAKAPTIDADAIVLDLEDSVPISEKLLARETVSKALMDWPTDGPAAFVRVNAPRFGWVREDAAVIRSHPTVGVIVPKVDRPIELEIVFDALGSRERELLVNIETPRSLLQSEAFADTHGVAGLFLGGEDLTLSLGMQRTSEGNELLVPRLLVLAAARAAGIAAYDTVFADFRDLTALEHDARRAAEMGFDGKFAIHPAQLPVIASAFTPSEVAVEHARRVVERYDAAVTRGEGAVAVDGQMVDPPVAERARALLRRAGII